jgi:hypothetical protein
LRGSTIFAVDGNQSSGIILTSWESSGPDVAPGSPQCRR